MADTDLLSTVAGLLGEPARTRILTALLGGRALTAKELAYFAGVTAATASSHLSRLVAGHLLVMERQGRCHYYRLRSADVARAIEGLMTVATVPGNGWPPHHRVEPALREARMCYDHVAGRLGVALCDMMLRRRYVVLADGGGEVTPAGERFLGGLGVDLPRARSAKRHYCRACIDWTERRHHVSGAAARWAPPWRMRCSSGAGSRAFRTAEPCRSPSPGGRSWRTWEWPTTESLLPVIASLLSRR